LTTLLEAWEQSGIGVASYDLDGLEITVICSRPDTLTVIIGTGNPKQLTPEDFGDLCRILGIRPEKGWKPLVPFTVAI
jgi:hypothetical protein